MDPPIPDPGTQALQRLQQREEILQICYWYQGEGLGTVFTPQSVMAFLQADPAQVAETFAELVASGDFILQGRGFAFTPDGKRTGARMFTEGFTDFQQPGHGECVDGCCEGDEPCDPQHLNCNHPSPYRQPSKGFVCDTPS